EGKFVAIDIETGAYEVDADELAASDRLLTRVPNAQIWLRRIGTCHARHFGSSLRSPSARLSASSWTGGKRLSALQCMVLPDKIKRSKRLLIQGLTVGLACHRPSSPNSAWRGADAGARFWRTAARVFLISTKP